MQPIYKKLETLIRSAAKKHNLLLKKAVLHSVAKNPKTQLHLYGRKEVVIGKRPKQKTYIVGIMANKYSIGFYSMAVYAFPKHFNLSPVLKKSLKGKSCFQITTLDTKTECEIAQIIETNIKLFKAEGWI